MDRTKLDEILRKHMEWLYRSKECGAKADLRCANLRGVDLRYACLPWIDLRYANLSFAILRGANLRGADLRGVVLRNADLRNADLRDTKLEGVILSGAKLEGVKIQFSIACPEKGSFIGFKRVGNYIIELKIPNDALRSSATSRKCRCSKAEVLSITNLDGTICGITCVHSDYDYRFIYTVGETVEVSDFDTNRWNECSTGIHFFMTRREAVEY